MSPSQVLLKALCLPSAIDRESGQQSTTERAPRKRPISTLLMSAVLPPHGQEPLSNGSSTKGHSSAVPPPKDVVRALAQMHIGAAMVLATVLECGLGFTGLRPVPTLMIAGILGAVVGGVLEAVNRRWYAPQEDKRHALRAYISAAILVGHPLGAMLAIPLILEPSSINLLCCLPAAVVSIRGALKVYGFRRR